VTASGALAVGVPAARARARPAVVAGAVAVGPALLLASAAGLVATVACWVCWLDLCRGAETFRAAYAADPDAVCQTPLALGYFPCGPADGAAWRTRELWETYDGGAATLAALVRGANEALWRGDWGAADGPVTAPPPVGVGGYVCPRLVEGCRPRQNLPATFGDQCQPRPAPGGAPADAVSLRRRCDDDLSTKYGEAYALDAAGVYADALNRPGASPGSPGSPGSPAMDPALLARAVSLVEGAWVQVDALVRDDGVGRDQRPGEALGAVEELVRRGLHRRIAETLGESACPAVERSLWIAWVFAAAAALGCQGMLVGFVLGLTRLAPPAPGDEGDNREVRALFGDGKVAADPADPDSD